MPPAGLGLFRDAVEALRSAGIRHALGGAVALAMHGASRATIDIDILTADGRALSSETWALLDASVDIRRGDADDPLRGVIRLARAEDRTVDVVVHRYEWQRLAIDRAVPGSVLDVDVPVLSVPDLILMKLYAGGPQDLWDVHQLLSIGDRDSVIESVNERLDDLGEDARSLWTSVLSALR
jgi:hypothetical protein